MNYIFSIPQPLSRFVSIEMIIEGAGYGDGLELQLPSWRPGRYELGNFAKNIKGFAVIDGKNQPVSFKKIAKDRWKLPAFKGNKIIVRYDYYAVQPDAGGCWVDASQLYINPVHCCMYVVGKEEEKCNVKLNIPKSWKVATGLNKISEHEFSAENFDRLADSPFIASPSIQHAGYTLDGISFNIWIQGECNPDWPRIITDFEKFTRVQLDTMKQFPAKDFHFLVQVLPNRFYHGVEHLNSTVLALGPGYDLMNDAMYNDFLGVASHELFHCWNVKSIRPVEMMPYDFTKENYADTGYVYEGVTTYYGDLFLARSGFFNLHQLLDEYSVRLQKHIDNPGRFNYSVSESSFDTWLDGYVPGVPGRKTSIYDEGCLLAWMLDFMIRSATSSKKSLDHVMQVLYFDHAKKQRGYTRDSFREIAEMVAGRSLENFFNDYVYKASSLETLLSEVISLAGLKIEIHPNDSVMERILGLKSEFRNNQCIITSVYPESPVWQSALLKDDEIIAINDTRISNNISELINYYAGADEPLNLLIASSGKIRSVTVKLNEKTYYNRYAIVPDETITRSQLFFRQEWLKHNV